MGDSGRVIAIAPHYTYLANYNEEYKENINFMTWHPDNTDGGLHASGMSQLCVL